MKFVVSFLLSLNLFMQSTLFPVSSCFTPGTADSISFISNTETVPAADLNISAPSAILMEASEPLSMKKTPTNRDIRQASPRS